MSSKKTAPPQEPMNEEAAKLKERIRMNELRVADAELLARLVEAQVRAVKARREIKDLMEQSAGQTGRAS